MRNVYQGAGDQGTAGSGTHLIPLSANFSCVDSVNTSTSVAITSAEGATTALTAACVFGSVAGSAGGAGAVAVSFEPFASTNSSRNTLAWLPRSPPGAVRIARRAT